jgi:ribosome-binding factor A
MSVRIDRVNQLLRAEITDLIRNHLKDPRVASHLSITEVIASADLGHAKVYVSIMAAASDRESILEGLFSATGFIKNELRTRLRLRRIPELHFILDTSIEHGGEVLDLIRSIADSQSSPTRTSS